MVKKKSRLKGGVRSMLAHPLARREHPNLLKSEKDAIASTNADENGCRGLSVRELARRF